MRYRLRTLLVVLTLGPAMLWMAYRAFVVATPPGSIRYTAEFNDVISSGSVVIHLDVDWSIPAVANRRIVTRLRNRINLDHRCNTVLWRRIDCTRQDTPLWQSLNDWLSGQDVDQRALYQGYGALIWIKDGQVIDSLFDSSTESVDKLFSRTIKAFSNN